MTWTKDLINTLDVFNVSNNLNLTNQHFVNMTKKIQTDLDKIQVIKQKIKISQEINLSNKFKIKARLNIKHCTLHLTYSFKFYSD